MHLTKSLKSLLIYFLFRLPANANVKKDLAEEIALVAKMATLEIRLFKIVKVSSNF